MDPDEVFTISFKMDSTNLIGLSSDKTKPINLSFIAKFKNGDNWYSSEPYVTAFTPPQNNANQSSYIAPAVAIILILVGIGAYMYRKRRQSREK
jgi:hypothetical protein